MQYRIIQIKTFSQGTFADGELSFFEGNRDIPFEIKRVYYIQGVSRGMKRGMHAHKALQQLIFCPYGVVKIVLDDGYKKEEVLLDDPSKGLVLEPGLWRDMYWEKDNSVLCVAASDYYYPDDYIRDYDEFLTYVNKKGEKYDECGVYNPE